ncbi:MAG: lysophospholipid acyltransferase family protein [Brumimicrobium sp.]|nr:lysophospholipid acyltransferase family protein [Brumimicrobium sp.]
MLYRILKFFLGIGIRLYYKEIRIKNKHNLPQKGPLIIIANHPNTLMDAWVVGMICKQPIYYMAKATLFDSKFKLKMLRSLNMIPINRQGEGKTEGVDNTDSLSECYKVLTEGKTLLIFPEGTSYQERVLRKLKTGTARIALETELLNQGNLGLKVVAVGINYSHPEKFRSNILVDIDKPRGVTDYLEEYKKEGISAARKLTAQFRTRLEHVLLTTETQEEENLMSALFDLLNSRYNGKGRKGVSGEVTQMKEIKDRIDEIKILQPWLLEEIKIKVKSMRWKLEKLRIKADFLDRRFRSTMFFRQIFTSVLFILIALPVAFFGILHNILQYLFTDWLVPKLSKDIEYYAPLAILVGIVLYPVSYAAFLFSANYFFGFKGLDLLLYFILMPLTGIFAYWFMRYLKHISYKWQYMLLMTDRKQMLKDLQEERVRLKRLIFEA